MNKIYVLKFSQNVKLGEGRKKRKGMKIIKVYYAYAWICQSAKVQPTILYNLSKKSEKKILAYQKF